MAFDNPLGYILSISICMQIFIIIFRSVQEIGPVSRFRIQSSAKPRPMINVILQSLGLDLVNINVHAKVYQNILNGLRVVGIFRELSGTSQTIRGTDKGDYRAHSESQPSASLSVDFLRVVQF